ncbi:uncharacterized protein TNCV_4756571 [Trichonephila clavipes]|nr:uncharacterized protein TNCV_4756571 [Trichonephila clavipes]
MNLTSSSHFAWGRFLNSFRSITTSLWTPPNKSSAPCACSEQWVHFRENFTKEKLQENALSSFATVMPIRKRGSLGRKTFKSKVVEHTRAAEAPDDKRARLQADQVHHSLARAAETPEQYQVRLQSQQVRQNASRAAEKPEQRQSRLHDDQARHRAARAAETPIQHMVHLLGLRRKRNVAITLKWRAQMHDGFMYNPRYDYESNNLLDIGRMSNVCLKCSALKWKGETPGMCCSSGKVKLPPILKPPEPLCSLLKGSRPSVPPCWTSSSNQYRRQQKYLQIYFLGEDEQVQRRLNLLDSSVDRNIVLKLQRMLHQHNSYVRSFKMAAEVMDDNTQVDYRIKISGKAPLKEHKGKFNSPSVSEVAIMIAGELGASAFLRGEGIKLWCAFEAVHEIHSKHFRYR